MQEADISDSVRRRIRMAVHGDPDKPVTFTTNPDIEMQTGDTNLNEITTDTMTVEGNNMQEHTHNNAQEQNNVGLAPEGVDLEGFELDLQELIKELGVVAGPAVVDLAVQRIISRKNMIKIKELEAELETLRGRS